jgi:monothiol glutaredoxin
MSDNPVFQKIQQEVDGNPVVLFMKGTPVFPQCGFSSVCVQVLSNLGIPFKGINVLEDMEIREGVKAYSNWPTIPQLYVKGEFVGGCDIIREMYETGELGEYFNTQGIDVQLANPE